MDKGDSSSESRRSHVYGSHPPNRIHKGHLLAQLVLKFKVSPNKAKLELVFKDLKINSMAQLTEAFFCSTGTVSPLTPFVHHENN